MAAVPFGFSVGDFVAGIELIHKATKALRSTSGATEQYQQTLLDLTLIESVLRRVQSLTPAKASEETIRIVQLCGLACQVPLDHFLNKIRKLELHLNFERHSGAKDILGIKRGSHKLQWAIVLEQDVAKLKASIGPGIEIINTLLQVESLQRDASTQEGLQRVFDQTASILPALGKVEALLQNAPTTEKYIQDLLPMLAHLTHQVSHSATSQEVKTLGAAFADVSRRFDQNASGAIKDLVMLAEKMRADQQNDNTALSTLIGHAMQDLTDLKKTAEASNCMLVTLVNKVPNCDGPTSRGATPLANHPECSSEADASCSTHLVPTLYRLLESLRHGLSAIILCLLCVTPLLRACLRNVNSISRSPRMLLDSNITFIDALDREFSLQYQQFRYWLVVSAWLQCQFQDCPGALRISRGRFAMFKDMMSTGRGAMIHSSDWEHTVIPGQRVLMSMYVGHQDPVQGHWPLRNACPSCGFVHPGRHKSSVWIKW